MSNCNVRSILRASTLTAAAALIAFMHDTAVAAVAVEGGAAVNVAQERMAIEDVLRRYVRALDDSDLDAYLATLTDDAKFVAAEGSYAGKQAIRDYVAPVMKSRLERRLKEGVAASATHHVVRTRPSSSSIATTSWCAPTGCSLWRTVKKSR